MKLLFPVPKTSTITQTFAGHIQRAKEHGWCPRPGPNCTTYYYGGIDWGIPVGTPVRSAADGTVSAAKADNSGYGNHVRIDHGGGYLTLYGHLQRWIVKTGDEIKAGNVIGYSGGQPGMPGAGNSSGPHLHFELRINGVPNDPAPFLTDSISPQPQPEPEPTPEPEEPPADAGTPPATWPTLPEVRITTPVGLRIRIQPTVNSSICGWLAEHTRVEVLRSVQNGADTWLQIGYNQYIAQIYGGDVYAQWV